MQEDPQNCQLSDWINRFQHLPAAEQEKYSQQLQVLALDMNLLWRSKVIAIQRPWLRLGLEEADGHKRKLEILL